MYYIYFNVFTVSSAIARWELFVFDLTENFNVSLWRISVLTCPVSLKVRFMDFLFENHLLSFQKHMVQKPIQMHSKNPRIKAKTLHFCTAFWVSLLEYKP